MDLKLRFGSRVYQVHRGHDGDRPSFQVRRIAEDGAEEAGPALPLDIRDVAPGEFVVSGPAGPRRGYAVRDDDRVWVHFAGSTWCLEVERGRGGRRAAGAAAAIASPMPGQVLRVLVEVGDAVEAGQTLMVVEAMKMQIEITAPHAGRVSALRAAVEDQVLPGVELADVEAEETPPEPAVAGGRPAGS